MCIAMATPTTIRMRTHTATTTEMMVPLLGLNGRQSGWCVDFFKTQRVRALAHACHTMSSGAPSGAGIVTLSFDLLHSLPVRGGCIGVAHALRRMVVCGGKPSLGVVPRGVDLG